MLAHTPLYNYTYQEVRDTLSWKLQRQGADAEDIARAVATLTDEVIQMLEVSTVFCSPDDFQLQVEQYREAKRRDQID